MAEADEMESSIEQQDEAIKNFFGFTPREMITGLLNGGKFYAKELTENIKKDLSSKGMSIEEAENFSQRFYEVFTSDCNRDFTMLMKYLRSNTFQIPDDILLPQDEVQINQYMSDDESKLDDEIDLLEREIIKTKYTKAELSKELQLLYDVVEPMTKKISRDIHQIEEITANIEAGTYEIDSMREI